MGLLPWILRREYTPFISKNSENPIFENILNNFSSNFKDEYHIEGEMGVPLPPFVARFSESLLYGNLLGTADEDGHVMLLDTRKTKDTSTVKEWSAHSNAVFDLAWIENEPKMVTASGDQTARLWDVEKAETIAIFRGHTCSLKSVSVAPHCKDIFVTGARDGKIMLWDTRCNRKNGFNNPIDTIAGAHILPMKETTTLTGKKRRSRRTSMYQADSKASVTSAIFLGSKTVISSGACDGTLKLWDLRKTYTSQKGDPIPLHAISFPGGSSRVHGYSCLVTNTTMSRLYAVCTNDIVYEYSTTNNPTKPMAEYHGHVVSSFYVKAAISPDDRYLLCGSSDGNAYIWRTDQSALPWLLKGHGGEVTSVTWSPNQGDKIVTCSDDNSFKIWRQFQPMEIQEDTREGTCQRKTGDSPGEQVKENASAVKISQLNTNRKATVHWIIRPLIKAKEIKVQPTTPLCKTPDVSVNIESPTTPLNATSYTTVTPKTAPVFSNRSSIKSKRISTPTPPSARRKLQSTTPRSSRTFLETWLNSPKLQNVDETIEIQPGENLNPIFEEKEGKCDFDNAATFSPQITSSKSQNQMDCKNCNKPVAKRRLVNKNRGKVSENSKVDSKVENIQTYLSGSSKKRKRDKNDGSEAGDRKNPKISKLDSDIQKENVSNDLDGVFEFGQESSGRIKNVLSENTTVKDLLDIAEHPT